MRSRRGRRRCLVITLSLAIVALLVVGHRPFGRNTLPWHIGEETLDRLADTAPATNTHGTFGVVGESQPSSATSNNYRLNNFSEIYKAFDHGILHSLMKDDYQTSHTTFPFLEIETEAHTATTSACPMLRKPARGTPSQVFQPFHEKGHVYSAHYDHRDHAIKVIAIGNPDSVQWLCQLWSDPEPGPQWVRAAEIPMPEPKYHPIFSFHFSCSLTDPEIPYAVSLVRSPCETSRHTLYIAENRMPRFHRNFTFCFSPFFHDFDDSNQLVESVEVNHIFGGDHFVFYNLSIGANVDRYIRHYVSNGLADVIQWQLPRGDRSNDYDGVYYFGQVAALSDCLLRNLNKSKFIVFVDLDEIIVPRSTSTLQDLIMLYQGLLEHKCGLLIRNTFFRMDWSSNPLFNKHPLATRHRIRTLLKTKRESLIRRGGNRSKYIAKTDALLVPAAHVPYRCRSPGGWETASIQDALLHHYRVWDGPSEIKDMVEDTVMHRYSDVIVRNIHQTHLDVAS